MTNFEISIFHKMPAATAVAAAVRVRPSHGFKGKIHFRGGLHLLSQKSVASFKHLSLKHSF